MLEKYSYAITIILLLSSIIYPIITAILNNRHNIKIKQIEIFEKDKKEALLDFIEKANLLLLSIDTEPKNTYKTLKTQNDYCISMEKLPLYFSNFPIDLINVEKFSKQIKKQ